MTAPTTQLKKVADTPETSVATYFGLRVKVVEQMSTYSLIRYETREAIVNTEDLSAGNFKR
jgi:hypothetical protein